MKQMTMEEVYAAYCLQFGREQLKKGWAKGEAEFFTKVAKAINLPGETVLGDLCRMDEDLYPDDKQRRLNASGGFPDV